MQKTAWVMATLASIASASPAAAEITLRTANYAAGVLVVKGETLRPHQRVGLDRRYFTRTNKFKEFRFRVRYLPNDCTIEITAGRERRPGVVRGCFIRHPADRATGRPETSRHRR